MTENAGKTAAPSTTEPPQQPQPSMCSNCGGNPYFCACFSANESVNYVGQQQKFGYNSFGNSNYRNHPGFSWKDNSQTQKPPFQPQQEKKSEVEALAKQLADSHKMIMDSHKLLFDSHQSFKEDVKNQFESVAAVQKNQEAIQRNHEAALRSLEHQLGQINQKLSSREQGTLPGNTTPNPKEQVKAITLRTGKEISNPYAENVAPIQGEGEGISTAEKTGAYTIPQKRGDSSKATQEETPRKEPPAYVPPIPYPNRLKKGKQDSQEQQYAKFLEVFSKIEVTIPLLEALQLMPVYAKFMQEICTKKRKLPEKEVVVLNEECSAILTNKLPPKKKDPGSFTIPCYIAETYFRKSLLDLGASINLMPLSTFQKLGVGELKPTKVSLQLADRSLAFPRGVLENVLVQVNGLLIPTDFIVLDMEEDREIPLILGRPFLATAGALIDVDKGELTLKVLGQHVTFNVFEEAKQSMEQNTCKTANTLDHITPTCKDLGNNLNPAPNLNCDTNNACSVNYEKRESLVHLPSSPRAAPILEQATVIGLVLNTNDDGDPIEHKNSILNCSPT